MVFLSSQIHTNLSTGQYDNRKGCKKDEEKGYEQNTTYQQHATNFTLYYMFVIKLRETTTHVCQCECEITYKKDLMLLFYVLFCICSSPFKKRLFCVLFREFIRSRPFWMIAIAERRKNCNQSDSHGDKQNAMHFMQARQGRLLVRYPKFKGHNANKPLRSKFCLATMLLKGLSFFSFLLLLLSVFKDFVLRFARFLQF